MGRLAVFAVVASLLGTLAAPAAAAGDCPDGDWFCDPAPIPDQGAAQPAPQPPGAPPRGAPPREPPPYPPPPYPEDEERLIRIDVPRVEPVHRRRHRGGYREWGGNLHARIGLLG